MIEGEYGLEEHFWRLLTPFNHTVSLEGSL